MTTNLRKFGPKQAGDPVIGLPCLACDVPFKAGDFTAQVVLGPGTDPAAQQLAREDKPYDARAVQLHWTCATGYPD